MISSLNLNLRLATFLGSELKNIISCEKAPPPQKKYLLDKLCFSLHFIPLDPDQDPRTQMNPDPDPHH